MAKYILYILLFALVSCAKTGSEEIFSLNANYLVGDEFYLKTITKVAYDDTTSANKDSLIEYLDIYKIEVIKDTLINNVKCRKVIHTNLNTSYKYIEYLNITNAGIFKFAHKPIHSLNGEMKDVVVLDSPILLIPRPLRYRDSFKTFEYIKEKRYTTNEQLTIEIGTEKYKCLGFEHSYKDPSNWKIKENIKHYYCERGLVRSRSEIILTLQNAEAMNIGYVTHTSYTERYIP